MQEKNENNHPKKKGTTSEVAHAQPSGTAQQRYDQLCLSIPEHAANCDAYTAGLMEEMWAMAEEVHELKAVCRELGKPYERDAIRLCGGETAFHYVRDLYTAFEGDRKKALESGKAPYTLLREFRKQRADKNRQTKASTARRIKKPATRQGSAARIAKGPDNENAESQNMPVAPLGREERNLGTVDAAYDGNPKQHTYQLSAALATIKGLVGDPWETLLEVINALDLKWAEVVSWAQQRAEWEANTEADVRIETTHDTIMRKYDETEAQNPAADPNPVGPANTPAATALVVVTVPADSAPTTGLSILPQVIEVDSGNASTDLTSDTVSFTVEGLPDASWSEEQLIEAARSQLAEIRVCHRKMAIHLYIFGRALAILHTPLKKRREWTKFITGLNIPETTAWRAMQLYQRTKTVGDIATLTISDAYRAVGLLPAPDDEDEENGDGKQEATSLDAKTGVPPAERLTEDKGTEKVPVDPAADDDDGDEDDEAEDKVPVPAADDQDDEAPPPKEDPNWKIGILTRVLHTLELMQITEADLAHDSADEYRDKLDEIEAAAHELRNQIDKLIPAAKPKATKKSPKVKATKSSVKGKSGRRTKGKDLATFILKALSKHSAGLKAAAITEKVTKLGYQSASKHLLQSVTNTLTKLAKAGRVVKDATKTFRLKEVADA